MDFYALLPSSRFFTFIDNKPQFSLHFPVF